MGVGSNNLEWLKKINGPNFLANLREYARTVADSSQSLQTILDTVMIGSGMTELHLNIKKTVL